MEMTANDIIERSLVKARIISPGDAIPVAIGNQVFDELNGLLESWALENLMVIADVEESFALTSGISNYTYGEGGDFDSVRPIKIRNESFIREGGMDYPVSLVTLDVYRGKTDKSTSGRPRIMSYNPEYPLTVVYLWPTPSSAGSIHIKSSKTINRFTDRTTDVELEPGYSRAIISNLAVEISPNFGKKVSNELSYVATQSKKAIKAMNSTPIKNRRASEITRMTGAGGGINILSLE